jgi:type II secretory pathway predicted ATPase ExeA
MDAAHDLHRHTLTELPHLREWVRQHGDVCAVGLAGPPRLQNLRRQPAMEASGARAPVLTVEGIQGQPRDYLAWLLETCVEPGPDALLTPAALQRLAAALATPAPNGAVSHAGARSSVPCGPNAGHPGPHRHGVSHGAQ